MADKEATAEIIKPIKLAKASADYSIMWPQSRKGTTPWSPSEIDKLEFVKHDEWKNIIADCRYYYKRDPFAATVVNKIVDLAINDIVIHAGSSRDSIVKIVDGIKGQLLIFLRNAALEYLTTGLVVPEISFDTVGRGELHNLGITRFSSLSLPVDMWIRDAATIVVKDPMFGGRKSYFMELSKELIYFVKNKGKYEDQSEDKELYKKIKEENPEIIKAVLAGEKKVLLENPFVIQYRTLANEAYPTPYLFPALESLKHKRNLKRMDYSLVSRVITAIQLIKMGSDEFPLTEDNQEQLEELKKEMKWREGQTDKNVERVFQLFGNHTLSIEWIFPDISILLDETKYRSVNQDIAVALGFPRILVTGETERTQTSDPEIATISPLNTMERIRESIFPIADRIIDTIVKENSLGGQPEVAFKPINLMAMSDFVSGIKELYLSGNLSRESFTAVFGFDSFEELHRRADEKELMKELGVDEFAPVPFSEEPKSTTAPKKTTKKKPAPKKKKKPSA